MPNSLLRNNGDGTFTDVSYKLGFNEVNRPTQTAGWADFDNDGDLDLFVGNETTLVQLLHASSLEMMVIMASLI